MRNLFACGVIAVAGLSAAACGGNDNTTDDVPVIDAPIVAIDAKAIDAAPDSPTIDAAQETFDFTCETNAAPTTIPASVSVSGVTQSLALSGQAVLPSVALELHNAADAPIGSTTSDATSGAYMLTTDTGGQSFKGSLFATKTGYRRTVIFPPTPVATNLTNLPTILITPDNFTFLNNLAAGMQNDVANGFILVAMVDCAGARIGGATLHVKKAGVEVGTQYPLAMLDPNAGKGVIAVFNVPPGDIEVSGAYFAHNLFTHTVRSYAINDTAPNGTLTQTVLTPGYPNP